jgi:N-acetylmuramoyl-L-alanine amidase
MRTVRLLALFLLSNQAVAQPLVVLDPGHGGQDPGAVGCGLEEKDVVLDVGRRLDGLLQAAGLRTAMTRADDRFIELRARAAFANDRGATLFVSMHANANAGQPATGTETWIARAASNTSNQLAGRLQRELVAEWGLRDRGVKREDFSVLVNTSMPAALTEMAFINRCDPDAALLGNADARQRIAAAHARAITGQLGVDAPPAQNTGTLRGVVFEDRGAGLDDTSARLGGARVVVTGAEARSAADTGAWTFQIAPGDQRVTVSLAGFREGSRTCLVQAGAETWCSVGLVRNPEVPPEDPDVGVPPETPADQGVIDQGVVADQGPPPTRKCAPLKRPSTWEPPTSAHRPRARTPRVAETPSWAWTPGPRRPRPRSLRGPSARYPSGTAPAEAGRS